MTEYDSSESSLDDSRGNVDRSNFVTDEGNGKRILFLSTPLLKYTLE